MQIASQAMHPPCAGAECNATLAGFNKAVSELGPLIKAGSVNLTSEEAAAKGASYGVDAAALSACALDIALAPFDDKGDPAEWQRYTGGGALSGNTDHAVLHVVRSRHAAALALLLIGLAPSRVGLRNSCCPFMWTASDPGNGSTGASRRACDAKAGSPVSKVQRCSSPYASWTVVSVQAPVPCAGELGSPKELQRFALEAFPSLVTRVDAASLHAFVATDALAPAVFLFTDKDETPGQRPAPCLNPKP